MKAFFTLAIYVLVINFSSLNLKEDVFGSKVSFELRDKIYQAIRIVESSIFYDRKDNTKIVKVFHEVIEIIRTNRENNLKKDYVNVNLYNTCQNGSKNFSFSQENNEIQNWKFYLLPELENLILFVGSFNFHDFFEGIFTGIYSVPIDQNLCYLNNFNKLKEIFFENFFGIVESCLSGENLVFHLKNIYLKIKALEQSETENNYCKFKQLREKILKFDSVFGSTLTAYRMISKDEEILSFLIDVYLSVNSRDYRALGYSWGKIISIILDFNLNN